MIKFSLKVWTWATLILYAECAVPATGDDCSATCDLIKSEISSSEACAKSKKSLPRPKIGRVCQTTRWLRAKLIKAKRKIDRLGAVVANHTVALGRMNQEGFDAAFELTCRDLCFLYGTSRAVPSHLSEACDKRKREVPRPIAHKACLDGFKAGLAATNRLINEKIEAMEGDARATLIGNNLSMLKQADAERSHSEEARAAKEVERTKQKEEEQERKRKTIEEKSAEVRREKEALSKKQELEAANAAEAAERNRDRRAKERQARIEATFDTVTAAGQEKLGGSSAAVDEVESEPSTADAQATRGSDRDTAAAAAAAAPAREAPARKTPDEVDETAAGLKEGFGAARVEETSYQEIRMKGAEDVEPATASMGSIEWLPVRSEGKESRHVDDLEANALKGGSADEKPHQEVLAAEKAQAAGIPNHSSGPVQAAEAAVEKKFRGDPEDKLMLDHLNDPRYREVLKAERVEGFQVSTQSAEEGEDLRKPRKDNVVAVATATRKE